MEALQMSLPLMPATIEELYVDQVPVTGGGIFSAYTPFGIKAIDSMFCWRIQKLDRDQQEIRRELKSIRLRGLKEWRKRFSEAPWLKSSTSPDTWEVNEKLRYVGENGESICNDILNNPHLHACIKENLIQNLDRVLAEGIRTAGSQADPT